MSFPLDRFFITSLDWFWCRFGSGLGCREIRDSHQEHTALQQQLTAGVQGSLGNVNF
jgi:hypothetical protein